MRRVLLVAFVLAMVGTIFGAQLISSKPKADSSGLQQFSKEELLEFDGTDMTAAFLSQHPASFLEKMAKYKV